MFAGQTPVALPLAAAALAALQVLRREPEIRNRLHENSRRLKEMLGRNDLLGAEFPGPIIPITPSTPTEAERTRSALLRAGIFPPLIRYPGCPAAGYFRFVVSSEHRASDLQKLANALR
jgi:7-keto-8-aminopelargonate synthetase-like enzyme